MDEIKVEFTKIINRINEIFPDENDLKGIQGISRHLIISSIEESSALINILTDFENHFETIVLKNVVKDLCNEISREINYSYSNISAKDLLKVVKCITKIRFSIRNTYYEISKEPIKTDAAIEKAKEELLILSTKIEELKKTADDLNVQKDSASQSLSEIETSKSTANAIVLDLEGKQKNIIQNEQIIGDHLTRIEASSIKVEEIDKNTTQWQLDIKADKEEFDASSGQYSDLINKIKATKSDIESSYDKIFGKTDTEGIITKGYLQEYDELKSSISTFLAEQSKKFTAQFNEIEGLLPGATSAGLAQAYQLQKESYKNPILVWSIIFISTIVLMIGFGVVLISTQISTPETLTLNYAFISLLKDLPFFIPTIWLAGYASKQQSQFKRLQQEYAFKETNAKSFHGHKIQIEELMKEGASDKDLLLQLVTQLVYITSKNPSETLDNKSHEDNSPIFKFAENFIPSFFKKDKDNKVS